MKVYLMIGAAAAALMTIPAIAQSSPPAGHDHDASKTRAEVEAKVADRFATADTNRDGTVNAAEVKAQAAARMTEWRAKMFAALDADKSGQISVAEWDAHHAAKMDDGKQDGHKGRHMRGHGSWGGDRADRWLDKADANKDGGVTLAEAKAKSLEHFDRADANKDGTLTSDERRSFHQKMRDERRAKRDS